MVLENIELNVCSLMDNFKLGKLQICLVDVSYPRLEFGIYSSSGTSGSVYIRVALDFHSLLLS